MGVYSEAGMGWFGSPKPGRHFSGVGHLMRFVAAGLVAFLALVLVVGDQYQAGEKITISDVMVKVHKTGLHTKVAQGKASEAEKKQLVEMYTALHKATPPKGDAEAWKKTTKAMLDAAEGAAKGDDKAAKSLAKLVNCKTCHKDYR